MLIISVTQERKSRKDFRKKKNGDHGLKCVPTTFLERMLENRNYKQNLRIKSEIYFYQFYDVLMQANKK